MQSFFLMLFAFFNHCLLPFSRTSAKFSHQSYTVHFKCVVLEFNFSFVFFSSPSSSLFGNFDLSHLFLCYFAASKYFSKSHRDGQEVDVTGNIAIVCMLGNNICPL